VPPDRVARVIDALEHLAAAAEDVALDGDPSEADVAPRPPGVARKLTGPRSRVREILTVAIDEAAETLAGEATRLLRGTGSAARVRAGVAEVSGLLDLLDSVEER
jgi:hypothetical protein